MVKFHWSHDSQGTVVLRLTNSPEKKIIKSTKETVMKSVAMDTTLWPAAKTSAMELAE